ncbi:MAG: NUDIX domain-containing protein [Candidatus Methylomirabilales bacterium]
MRIERDLSKVQAIHPSVSAVIFDGPKKLLLIRRADSGEWGLPGGAVEIGESVEKAILREVREETGLNVEVIRLIGVYSDPQFQVVAYPDGRVMHYVNICFQCGIVGGTFAPSPEALEVGFFAVAALPEPLVPLHRIRVEDALIGRDAAFIR